MLPQCVHSLVGKVSLGPFTSCFLGQEKCKKIEQNKGGLFHGRFWSVFLLGCWIGVAGNGHNLTIC